SVGVFLDLRLLDPSGRPVPLHLVAVDGIALAGRRPPVHEGWLLPPGGRADVLVRLEEPGVHRLRREPVEGSPASFREELATVEAAGPRRADLLPERIPGRLPHYLQPIDTASRRLGEMVFGLVRGEAPGPCGQIPSVFTLDGAPYRRDRIDVEIDYGAQEEWLLTNVTSKLHAFHIHVNPFQVLGERIDPDGPDDPSNWLWRDVAAVPPTPPGSDEPGRLTIRSRFVSYSGEFVRHCHVLVHEDLGMMQNVRVGPGGAPPGARLTAG
ncbi:MAG: multicopper oxidase domain-containing protein, partial [Thermoanaerobaculia bacterium]|nr:multicopper oxidase domain-containing protein [Thermoanaerobaculia bacterium]